jgi:LysM repeat protein
LTRPTSVALGFSAAAAALSMTIVNSTAVASAAVARPPAAQPSSPSTEVTFVNRLLPMAWAELKRDKNRASERARRRAHNRTYTVRPGDSFWSIAALEHVSWYNLVADNGMELDSPLYAGRVLHLPAPGEKPHAPLPLPSAPAVVSVVGSSSPSVSTGAAQVSTVAPTTTTTTTVTPSSGMSSFEQCVISRESGGNPQVTNASGHWGLFQFSESTWVAYGGSPAEFGNASAAVQEQVFANAMARGGESNWAPYDGC